MKSGHTMFDGETWPWARSDDGHVDVYTRTKGTSYILVGQRDEPFATYFWPCTPDGRALHIATMPTIEDVERLCASIEAGTAQPYGAVADKSARGKPFDQVAWDALVARHGERANAAADDIVEVVSEVARGDDFCALIESTKVDVWQKTRIRILEALRDAEGT